MTKTTIYHIVDGETGEELARLQGKLRKLKNEYETISKIPYVSKSEAEERLKRKEPLPDTWISKEFLKNTKELNRLSERIEWIESYISKVKKPPLDWMEHPD